MCRKGGLLRMVNCKFKFICIVLLYLIILFTCGCTVANVLYDDYNNIAQDPSFEYKAPQVIHAIKKTENLSIEYNAEVHTPSNSKLSVFEVSKRNYSASDYREIMDYLEPNGEWYAQDKRTSDELNMILDWLQDPHDFYNNEDVEPYLSYIEEAVNHSDNTLPKKFRFDTIHNGNLFIAYCRNNGHYSAIKGELGGNSFTYMRNADAVVIRERNLEYDDPCEKFFLQSPTISYQDAQTMSDEILTVFGMDDEYSLKLSERSIGMINNFSVSNGWSFIYTRYNAGLNSEYIDNYDIWINSGMPQLVSPWGQEYILVYVDGDGVFCFSVHGAGVQGKCIAENVVIEEFNLLTETIERQLEKQHTPIDPRIYNSCITINRIELCIALVSDSDIRTGVIIPAWAVHYSLVYSINGNTVEDDLCTFFNAIDGNYIEPRISINEIKKIMEPK